ncbi:MAG: dipeptide/oligopeptide/nickel ABC transporter ATP-binding protein [Nocardioides sp.]
MSETSDEHLLLVRDLVVDYGSSTAVGAGGTKAVDGVSFHVDRGETLALVGESGCGKSTTAFAVAGLLRPTSGSITFLGQDIATLRRRELKEHRRHLAVVFQDPYSSLNPRMRIDQIVLEPLQAHREVKGDGRTVAAELLDRVGLDPRLVTRYPRELSGGQRQRVCIARALALGPDLLICDEATSSLDVSMQAQIINLLKDLQEQLQMSYLFISHDLAVVNSISDRIAVMYAGRIVEEGPAESVVTRPQSEYAKTLLAAALTVHTAPADSTETPGGAA